MQQNKIFQPNKVKAAQRNATTNNKTYKATRICKHQSAVWYAHTHTHIHHTHTHSSVLLQQPPPPSPLHYSPIRSNYAAASLLHPTLPFSTPSPPSLPQRTRKNHQSHTDTLSLKYKTNVIQTSTPLPQPFRHPSSSPSPSPISPTHTPASRVSSDKKQTAKKKK